MTAIGTDKRPSIKRSTWTYSRLHYMANFCPFYLGVADGDLRLLRSSLHNAGWPCKRFLKQAATLQIGFKRGSERKIQSVRLSDSPRFEGQSAQTRTMAGYKRPSGYDRGPISHRTLESH